jgi:uncharacterized membrane-anchored protein
MKRTLVTLVIVLGILAQFALLASMLIRREYTLRHGEICRFETAPVDPYDAFRGQYVQLDYPAFRDLRVDRSFKRNTWCYLALATSTNGYSVVTSITASKPVSGTFIKARVKWCSKEHINRPKPENKYHSEPTGKWKIHLDLPFSRYYMPERLAPKAEDAYRSANRRTSRKVNNAAARVRVWKGVAVIEELEINGTPIRDYIKKEREKAP